jgi:hypothetical protein
MVLSSAAKARGKEAAANTDPATAPVLWERNLLRELSWGSRPEVGEVGEFFVLTIKPLSIKIDRTAGGMSGLPGRCLPRRRIF